MEVVPCGWPASASGSPRERAPPAKAASHPEERRAPLSSYEPRKRKQRKEHEHDERKDMKQLVAAIERGEGEDKKTVTRTGETDLSDRKDVT